MVHDNSLIPTLRSVLEGLAVDDLKGLQNHLPTARKAARKAELIAVILAGPKHLAVKVEFEERFRRAVNGLGYGMPRA